MDQTETLIRTLNPALQPYAIALVNAARAAGIPLVVISAQRSGLQNASVGGSSGSLHLDQSHLTGQPGALAFDVAVQGYTRDEVPYEFWQALGQWAERYLGLRWGGRFLHGGEPDVNHFDTRTWMT